MTMMFISQNVTDGLDIVQNLLERGVEEWVNSPTHDDDDWQYIDTVRAEQSFAQAILPFVKDEQTALIITKTLVVSALYTFESLIQLWDEVSRDDVPSITEGITAAREWKSQNGF